MAYFRIEAGLPPYGRAAMSFPDPAAFREGLVVSFTPAVGDRWTGNFARGFGTLNTVRDELGAHATLVVSAGQAFLVDVEKKIASQIVCPVLYIEYVDDQKLVVLGDGLSFYGVREGGVAWKTRRISWDGCRIISIDGEKVIGEAFTPMGALDWVPFELNLASGEVKGGSYDGPP